MTQYQFQLEDFALSEDGVHLLRNRFNFKTISYLEIKKASIERTTEIKNATLTLTLGIALVCFAFYQARWVLDLFGDPTVYHIYIESIVLPVIPGAVGLYCIYASLRRGPVLKIEIEKAKYKLRLRKISKQPISKELENYLRPRLGSKLTIDKFAIY